MKNILFSLALLSLLPNGGHTFTISTHTPTICQSTTPRLLYATTKSDDATLPRRDALLKTFITISTPVSLLFSAPSPSLASGGATAGGAYLLSAKQRYNQRVLAGVTSYLALGAAFTNKDSKSIKEFFDGEEVGSWSDFSSAGYLLSNAFRRNSSAAPDTLPSVKKWKAFAAQVEASKKSVKKKDSTGAVAAYKKGLELLDDYLEAVELPPVVELGS